MGTATRDRRQKGGERVIESCHCRVFNDDKLKENYWHFDLNVTLKKLRVTFTVILSGKLLYSSGWTSEPFPKQTYRIKDKISRNLLTSPSYAWTMFNRLFLKNWVITMVICMQLSLKTEKHLPTWAEEPVGWGGIIGDCGWMEIWNWGRNRFTWRPVNIICK